MSTEFKVGDRVVLTDQGDNSNWEAPAFCLGLTGVIEDNEGWSDSLPYRVRFDPNRHRIPFLHLSAAHMQLEVEP